MESVLFYSVFKAKLPKVYYCKYLSVDGELYVTMKTSSGLRVTCVLISAGHLETRA